jgi:hypothetical protein
MASKAAVLRELERRELRPWHHAATGTLAHSLSTFDFAERTKISSLRDAIEVIVLDAVLCQTAWVPVRVFEPEHIVLNDLQRMRAKRQLRGRQS